MSATNEYSVTAEANFATGLSKTNVTAPAD
jgi:hypothetical protein